MAENEVVEVVVVTEAAKEVASEEIEVISEEIAEDEAISGEIAAVEVISGEIAVDVEDVVEIVEVVVAAEVVHQQLVSCKKSTKTRTSKSSPTCTGSILSLVRQEAATRCKSSLIFPTS